MYTPFHTMRQLSVYYVNGVDIYEGEETDQF